MNEKEINEDFDREYERYSREHKEGFVKLKMPTYFIAKHSDEDLRAAVLAEREACAQLCDEKALYFEYDFIPPYDVADSCAEEIRARGGEMKDGIALASIEHPEGDPVPDDHEINPDSLETMEIYIPIDERIKELARQAGFTDFPNDENGVWITDGYWNEQLERFAELVRQEEREACAEIARFARMHSISDAIMKRGRNMSTKPEKIDTSEERVHETDKSVHDDDDIQEYKRPWIGLTDEEIHEIIDDCTSDEAELEELIDFSIAILAVEAKLKEKNNG